MNAATQKLALLGQRWALPVLLALSSGPMRFCVLARAIPGISHRMLSASYAVTKSGERILSWIEVMP